MIAPVHPTLLLASASAPLTSSGAATEISECLMRLAAQPAYPSEVSGLLHAIESGLEGVGDAVDPEIQKRMKKGARPLQSEDRDVVSEFLGYLAHDATVLTRLADNDRFRGLCTENRPEVPALEGASRLFLEQQIYQGNATTPVGERRGAEKLSALARRREREIFIEAARRGPIGPLQTEDFMGGQGWRVPFHADPSRGEVSLEDVSALLLYNSLPPQDVQRLGFLSSLRHFYRFLGMARIVDEAARRFSGDNAHAHLAHSLSLQFFRGLGAETAILPGQSLNDIQAAQDEGRGVIILPNHSSHFDIPLSYITFSRLRPVFVARASLGRWPVIGSILRHDGSLLLDRQSPAKALKTMQQFTIERLNQGRAVIIFPEGTRRAPSDFGMGTFDIGAFAAAKAAFLSKDCKRKPLLVNVAIHGTDFILPKSELRLGHGHPIVTSILPPLDVADVARQVSKPRLADQLRCQSWSQVWHELAPVQAYLNSRFRLRHRLSGNDGTA